MKNLSLLSVEVKHRDGGSGFYILSLEEKEQTLVSCKSNDGCHRWLLLGVLLSLASWDTLQNVEFKIQMSFINHLPLEFSVYPSEPPGSSPWCIIKTDMYGITLAIKCNLKKKKKLEVLSLKKRGWSRGKVQSPSNNGESALLVLKRKMKLLWQQCNKTPGRLCQSLFAHSMILLFHQPICIFEKAFAWLK